ncbi:hypothetical protein D9611_012254 [Ephemerocybe angulata]|uniref:Uncharacterized protein n=1 Tax=Ephemerocybe angulata TaxID=980116 RepID=A0A8H5ES83_9AGAR|nr:hypothetical protein D9611_012254 [Tulosesus angulatus]
MSSPHPTQIVETRSPLPSFRSEYKPRRFVYGFQAPHTTLRGSTDLLRLGNLEGLGSATARLRAGLAHPQTYLRMFLELWLRESPSCVLSCMACHTTSHPSARPKTRCDRHNASAPSFSGPAPPPVRPLSPTLPHIADPPSLALPSLIPSVTTTTSAVSATPITRIAVSPCTALLSPFPALPCTTSLDSALAPHDLRTAPTAFFQITNPTTGTEWVDGQTNVVTWEKGLLDNI